MPNQTTHTSKEKPERLLTNEEIAAIFAKLHLESPQQREKFRAMSQCGETKDETPMRFWLTGTTEEQDMNEGGSHA